MILCYLYNGMADFEVTFLLHRLRNQGHRMIVGIAETLEPVTAQSGLTFKTDVSKLTSNDRREIARRVENGENISF